MRSVVVGTSPAGGCWPAPTWFYARGTFGGDHDHRDLDCVVVAGGAGGPRGGPADAVHQQPQADRPGLPRSRADQQVPADGRLGRIIGPASRPAASTNGSPAAGSTTSFPTWNSRRCTTWASTRERHHGEPAGVLQRVSTPLAAFYCPTAAAVDRLSVDASRPAPYVQRCRPVPTLRPQRLRGLGGDSLDGIGGLCPRDHARRRRPDDATVSGRTARRARWHRHLLRPQHDEDGRHHRRHQQHLPGRREVLRPGPLLRRTCRYDDQGWDTGWDWDTVRWSQYDTRGLSTDAGPSRPRHRDGSSAAPMPSASTWPSATARCNSSTTRSTSKPTTAWAASPTARRLTGRSSSGTGRAGQNTICSSECLSVPFFPLRSFHDLGDSSCQPQRGSASDVLPTSP